MKVKHILSVVCLWCFVGAASAQDVTTEEEETDYSTLSRDSLSVDVGLIPESMDANVDSLLRSWHVSYFSKRDEYCHDDEANVWFPDSVYRMRLESLPRVIPMPYNKVVRDCIDLYASRRRALVRYMLGMADFYFPIIEQVLDEHNLPIELKYLTVVESALNPVAVSRAGACGLWQFMLPTGKIYGLEINSLIDDRRDPVKATHAACRYFKDMYDIYGDWNLVLAAYNCGPGNVNKAIRRAGGKTDFWEIFPYLPRETRSYVPLFIAANYIMNFYCEHNICPVQTSLPLATDTIMVTKALHLEQVAEVLKMDIEQVRALNPQYKRDIIPGNASPRVLKLPIDRAYAFIDKEDTLYVHRVEELLAGCIAYQQDDASRREKITHRVVAGETVSTIADRYGVAKKDVRQWNGLKSNRVPVGRKLTLYVDNGGVVFASSEKPKTSPAQKSAPQSEVAVKDGKGFVSYKVKAGDSLYTISRKYPGVSADVIRKANGLPNVNIHPGQILKIPVG